MIFRSKLSRSLIVTMISSSVLAGNALADSAVDTRANWKTIGVDSNGDSIFFDETQNNISFKASAVTLNVDSAFNLKSSEAVKKYLALMNAAVPATTADSPIKIFISGTPINAPGDSFMRNTRRGQRQDPEVFMRNTRRGQRQDPEVFMRNTRRGQRQDFEKMNQVNTGLDQNFYFNP